MIQEEPREDNSSSIFRNSKASNATSNKNAYNV